MITRPFNFEARLRPTATGLDFVPFVDVCLMLLFFSLLGSRFVLPPGLDFELPRTRVPPGVLTAPNRVLTVSEVEGRETIFFEGRHLTLDSLDRFLRERAAEFAGEVLLLRIDSDVSMRLSTRVFELATAAGFAHVVVAAEAEPAARGERNPR